MEGDVAIPLSGTFEYQAEFTGESFGSSDIVLRGTDLGGHDAARLVGLNPTIRFWNERIVIVATDQHKSSARNVSFSFGSAVSLSALPGDRLYLVRTGAGGIGLSVLREQKLVLAVGAVTATPLGKDVQVNRRPRNSYEDPIIDPWLEVRVGEGFHLREREVAEVGGYHFYIERTWEDGVPGIDECISVVIAGDSSMTLAAMRSAIILNNGIWKITSWDCTEHSSPTWA